MSNQRLPPTIKRFVDQQTTLPVTEVWDADPEDQFSPYGTYYYRAIACMLLSERVQAKTDGHPNMTDVNRIGKEANFNQYLFERVAKFLVGIEALKPDRAQRRYVEGPNIEAFWKHDADRLRTGANRAIARLFEGELGLQPWSRRPAHHAHLIELLILFFASFKGRAILEPSFGQVFLDFTRLPAGELNQLARDLSQKKSAGDLENWRKSLDTKGQKALLAALYTAEWAYYTERDATGWLFASPIGLGMLGLETTPAAPALSDLFKALPNLSVFAGAGLGRDKLVPLFRHCVIKKIDQVFEFKLDQRRLSESPAATLLAEELRKALGDAGPLPSTTASVLAAKTRSSGEIGIRLCSALVKPENAETAAAIRSNPKLKGYLEPGAPAGYLLIKAQSSPENFAHRCQLLGFKVKAM